jgi:hypothetical protein
MSTIDESITVGAHSIVEHVAIVTTDKYIGYYT